MKYQLITYTNIKDTVVKNSDNITLFDEFKTAVSKGKFATLNELQSDGSYKTLKLYHSSRVENKQEKPS